MIIGFITWSSVNPEEVSLTVRSGLTAQKGAVSEVYLSQADHLQEEVQIRSYMILLPMGSYSRSYSARSDSLAIRYDAVQVVKVFVFALFCFHFFSSCQQRKTMMFATVIPGLN